MQNTKSRALVVLCSLAFCVVPSDQSWPLAQGRLHGDDGRRRVIERGEVDFERVAVLVGVDHCADVSTLQAFLWDGHRRHDAVEFFDQREASLLNGQMRASKLRVVGGAIVSRGGGI